MYFLSVNALARALKENRLDEWEKTKYLIGNIIVFSLNSLKDPFGTNQSPAQMPIATFPGFLILEFFLIVLINAYGIYFCYKANQEGDGKGFIERFTCLYFPISLEIGLTLFAVFYLLSFGVLGYLLMGKTLSAELPFIIAMIVNPIALIIKYWWICKKIVFIAQK